MQGSQLKALRKGCLGGITQQELADAIGMSRWMVSQMEKDDQPIERRTELAVLALSAGISSIADLPEGR